MNRGIHPALAFAKQVEGWSPCVFSQVDKWRETDSLAPWRFMTFRQCKRWFADWLKRNPAPEEGFLCPQIMSKRKGSAVLTLIWQEEPRSTAEDQRLC